MPHLTELSTVRELKLTKLWSLEMSIDELKMQKNVPSGMGGFSNWGEYWAIN